MKQQLEEDIKSEHPSLLAKWLQSKNRKSSTKHLARYRRTLRLFGMRADEYRKTLSQVRRKIQLVETQMCAKRFDDIKFEQVPSQAARRYAPTFRKWNEKRYKKYLEDVKNGKKEIKASTSFPYEILRGVISHPDNEDTYEVLWKALPNWIHDENLIVVADVSGSMESNNRLPLYCSISLAMYCAERNKGPFHNKFITFSKNPTIYDIEGETLIEKYRTFSALHIAENTDLLKVFALLLRVAKKHNLPQEEMPAKIYVVSDMEFDGMYASNIEFGNIKDVCKCDDTTLKVVKMMYTKAGYKVPTIIFWNVNARHTMAPVEKDENNTYLVSGCSPSIFKALMETKVITPIDLMLEVLNKDRYQGIVI
jgi:hypothetical protein